MDISRERWDVNATSSGSTSSSYITRRRRISRRHRNGIAIRRWRELGGEGLELLSKLVEGLLGLLRKLGGGLTLVTKRSFVSFLVYNKVAVLVLLQRTALRILGRMGTTAGLDLALTLSAVALDAINVCLLYTSPSPRDLSTSRMPSSA